MPYVKRDNSLIVGLFNQRQQGIAEEFLPDNDAEVVAFRNPPPPTNDEIYDRTIQNQALLKALVLSINDGSIVPGANVSNARLKSAIKAKM